jgi:hypothetical protein
MERPETPVFEGGMSQIIEFEEVVSKSATENQPLGDLAGRGVSSRPNGSGKLHFKVTEPSYIMGIMAITPLIDYSQGNDWDIVNLLTKDDLDNKDFTGKILVSPGLGKNYVNRMKQKHLWKNEKTNVEYQFRNGQVTMLPKYYKQKLFTEVLSTSVGVCEYFVVFCRVYVSCQVGNTVVC